MLERFTDNVNRKLEILEEEINVIKENKPYSIIVLEEVIKELKADKVELINKNEELREKHSSICQTTSDLRSKIINLQNENSSLLTALRLVQQDSTRIDDSGCHNGNKPQTKLTRDDSCRREQLGKCHLKYGNGASKKERVPTDIETETRSDSDSEEDDESVKIVGENLTFYPEPELPNRRINKTKEIENKRKKGKENNMQEPSSTKTTTPTNRVDTSNSPDTIIIGDSMVKGLRSDKISKSVKHKTQVKSFPGSTVEDLTDYIKPSLKRNPKNIIIHVGSKDLKRKRAKDIAKSIEKVCQSIKSEYPQTSISVSEIIHREDNHDLAAKAMAVNKELARYSEQEKFYLVKNGNIDKSKLNLYGLHLNKQGSAALAKNIINHINCLNYL